MYDCPIQIYQDLQTQFVQHTEEMVVEAVQKCNVNVDEEELIRALKYDREQYEKGFKDGVNYILDKVKSEIENHCGLIKENHCRYCYCCNSVMGVREILEILDKHKSESEKR